MDDAEAAGMTWTGSLPRPRPLPSPPPSHRSWKRELPLVGFTELFTNQQPFLEISNHSTDLLVTSLPQSIGRQGSVGCGPSAVGALPPAVIHGRHGGRRLPRPRGRPWRQRGAGAAASAEPGQSYTGGSSRIAHLARCLKLTLRFPERIP